MMQRHSLFSLLIVLSCPSLLLSELIEPDPTCVCDPLCDALDPQECPRLLHRLDCPCCTICARQIGQECDKDVQLCDTNRGLHCLNGVCQVDAEAILCNFENATFAVGEQFNSEDCNLECRCTADAQVVCQATECRRGLFKKGTFSGDPLCEERPSSRMDERCCVLAVCAASDAAAELAEDEVEDASERSSSIDGGLDDFKVIEVLENDEEEDTLDSKGQTKRTTPDMESTSTPSTLLDGAPITMTSHGSSVDENIEVLQLTSTTIQVQFPRIGGGNLMYRPLSGHHAWENALILAGNKIFTLTGLQPGTEYALKWRAPDKQHQQIRVATRGLNEKSPKAIVIAVGFDSATVSFDHFAPNDNQHGYVAMYMEVEDGHWRIFDPARRSSSSRSESDATVSANEEKSQESVEHEVFENQDEEVEDDLPTLRLTGLKPDTKYEARVAVYKEYESRSLGLMTNIVHFQTEHGCVYQNRSRGVGTFALGCEELCTCHDSGHVECEPRCREPLQRPGSRESLENQLCVETFVDDDKCCVLVTCAGTHVDLNSNRELDRDSPGADNGPCTGIKCGPNAACRHEVFRGEQAATLCVCEEGFIGDPDSVQGCRLETRLVANQTSSCVVNVDEVYDVGESWHDNCDYTCNCNEQAEIVCQPRCKPLPESVPASCELRADPNDAQCCTIMFCPVENESKHTPDMAVDALRHDLDEVDQTRNNVLLKPVTLDAFDGCVYKNNSYEKGQRFYDGCEQQCQCMGYGDMVCLSRCPPTAFVAPGQNCYTLPDASDPCCNITVCDKPFLDPEQNVAKTTEDKDSNHIDHDHNDHQLDADDEVLRKRARIIHKQDPASFQVETVPDTSLDGRLVGRFVLKNDQSDRPGGDLYALDDNYLVIKNFGLDTKAAKLVFVSLNKGQTDSTENNLEAKETAVTFVSQEENNVLLRLSSPLASVERLLIRDDQNQHVMAEAILNDDDKNDDKDGNNKDKNDDSENDRSDDEVETSSSSLSGCMFKGSSYAVGSSFHDGCSAFCKCSSVDQVVCHSIRCPSKFGLDVIHPFCLEWDEHSDFVPEPPLCCPPAPVCVNDGSCSYEGHTFNNYDTLPMNLTGCDQRCYCEDGKVLCQDACYELSEEPPQYLACAPHKAIKEPQDDRPCCMRWACPSVKSLLPSELSLVSATSANATMLKLTFALPVDLDGLNGHFEVRLAIGQQGHPDPSQWPLAEVASPSTQLNVGGSGESVVYVTSLLPNKQYFLRTTLHLQSDDETHVITSPIFTARTPPITASVSSSSSLRSVEMNLTSSDVDSTSLLLQWRTFSVEEKRLIDGVQIRYVQLPSSTSAVPGTTPFIHRDTNFYRLEELRIDTEYEIDLYLIPMPDAQVEMLSKSPIRVRTAAEKADPFDFRLHLQLDQVRADGIHVSWTGVPQPHQQFVHIYRLLFNDHQDTHSIFKVTKLDDQTHFHVKHLRANTEYEVWLEAYLRNGKVFQSNVIKAVTTATSIGGQEMALPSSSSTTTTKTSYFGAMLVAVAIAVLAVLALLVLTALYLRRTTTYKAIISGGGAKRALNDVNNGNDNKSSAGRNGGQGSAVLSHVNEESVEMNGLGASST